MQRAVIISGMMGFAMASILAASWQARGETGGGGSISELYQESYTLEARNDSAGALAKIQEVVRRSPEDYVAQLRVGWLLYMNRRYTESAAAYRKAVRLRPRAVEPKLGLMLPLISTRRNQEALTVADEIIGVDPGNFLARSRKAYLLYQLGRYAKAEVEYRQVLDLYPSNTEMMAGLGWSLLKQGKRPDACEVFDELLLISSDHVTGKVGRTQCGRD